MKAIRRRLQPTSAVTRPWFRVASVESLERRQLLSVSVSRFDSTSADDTPPKTFQPYGNFIVGGKPSSPTDWPWMASLQSEGHLCGGALIAPDVVVTAAHCIEGSSASQFSVVVGRHDLTSNAGEEIGVREVIAHDDYDSFTNDFDIGIVLLGQSSAQEPIPLVDRDNIGLTDPGAEATILGWGTLGENTGRSPNTLHQVTVPIVSNAVANGRQSYQGGVTTRMLAAGLAEGGKDSCQGDSGGPLVVADDDGQYHLAGITSWGDGCGQPDKYGIYTRISSFTDWILSNSGISSEGRASFSKTRYASSEMVEVLLADADLAGVETATLRLRSVTGDEELVTVTEVTPGRFSGQIALAESDVVIGNQRLEVMSNEVIEVLYEDVNTGEGESSISTSTARIVSDDFGNGPDDAGLVEASQIVEGEIELSGDVDWFRFAASSTSAYEFDVALSGSLDDSILGLYNESGEELIQSDDDGGEGLASHIEWQPTSDQVVHLVVSAYGAMVGTYHLQISAVEPIADDHGNRPSDATRVGNESVSGEIDGNGDVDWFAIPVTAGTRYSFETKLESISDTFLRLVAEDGMTELAFNDDGGDDLASSVTWIATYTGIVYAEVSGFDNASGAYSLIVTVPTTIQFPSSTDGNIEHISDVDLYVFEAHEGVTYTLATELIDLNDSVIRLLDANSEELARDDDSGGELQDLSSRLVWTAPDTAPYFVEVSGFGQSVGTYQLTAASDGDDHGGSFDAATDISSLPFNIDARMDESDDRDWFRLDVVEGFVYRLDVHSEEMPDLVIQLWDRDASNVLVTTEQDQDSFSASVVWEASQTGPLHAEVFNAAGGIGDYRLSVLIPYGDSTFDGVFTSSDLVAVFRAGQYQDGIPDNSTWASGDWNGDGEFNTTDLVTAFSGNIYEPMEARTPNIDVHWQFPIQIDKLAAAVEQIFADAHLV